MSEVLDLLDIVSEAVDFAENLRDLNEPKEVPHSFMLEDEDKYGRPKYWYCRKCGQRNAMRARACVDCGEKH